MYKTPFIILVIVVNGLSAPVDEPIKVDLPVYAQPLPNTDYNSVNSLEPENYPGGEPVPSSQAGGKNLVTNKLKTVSDLIGDTLNAKTISFGGPFSPPITTLETAIEETEGYGSKALSIKENIHHAVAGLFQPKPIVDTISESEKYGNTGDKFYSVGKALVGGAEGASNFINSILEVPGAIFQKVARAATEKLNYFGGKLIGL